MKYLNKPELIAPAGNLEKMKTAFAFGADAVYAGIPDFSLRVRINDFDMASLAEAIKYAHKLKKKVYVTVNILAHNKHLEELPFYVKKLKLMKPDGLIVSDPGVMQAIKKIWPTAKIHLSTQANCTNWQAAKFWQSQGVKRVVLGREVTLDEIKTIHQKNPILELESFVHGAMCMAYSGRCFLSKYFTGRSANLGDCIQPCRWKYEVKYNYSNSNHVETRQCLVSTNANVEIKPEGRAETLELVEEQHGSYILNSLDLCLLPRTEDLIKAGISSFKIEGRAKSNYYLAVVVGAYRAAIDIVFDKKLSAKNKKQKLKFLYNELENKVVSRGYTSGFIFGEGKTAQNLESSHNKCEWEFCGQTISHNTYHITHNNKKVSQSVETRLIASLQNVKNKKYHVYVKIHNSLRIGDEIEIVTPEYGIIKQKVDKIFDIKTGEKLNSSHGGQGKTVILETKRNVPEYSVIRRKI